jgi:mannan endo-1,4-beta-mannosidase
MVKSYNRLFITLFFLFAIFQTTFSNNHTDSLISHNHNFMDKKTYALYCNLKKISEEKKIMFGCANPATLKYVDLHIYKGFNGSDCKDITGDNPAFQESDFMWHIKDSLKTADCNASKKAFKRGAVVGYCWHMRGMNSHSFYAKKDNEWSDDKELARKIVSGLPRENNPELNWLLTQYDKVVIPVLKDFNFPIIFRPWHEMNGDWFWWGSRNITPQEYIKLYRITVDYLRSQGIKNVLYAWSPDTRADFDYYPGDDYVDILGLDIYEPGIYDYKPMSMVLNEVGKLTDYAADHGKVAAITETGLRKDSGKFMYPEVYPDFWTRFLLEPILNDTKASRIVWIESWYNADWGKNKEGQFYIPYKGIEKDRVNGQQAIDDFLKFYKSQATLFEKDLPDMYKLKK